MLAFFNSRKSSIDFISLCNFECRGQCVIMLLKSGPWINPAMNQQANRERFNTAFSKVLRNNYGGNVSSRSVRRLSRAGSGEAEGLFILHCPGFTAKQERVIKSLMLRGNVWSIPRSMSWVKSTSQKQTWENLKPKKGHGINNPFKMLHRVLTASRS